MQPSQGPVRPRLARPANPFAKPLILVGPLWRNSLGAFVDPTDGYIGSEDKMLLKFALNADEAVAILKAHD